MGGRVRERVRVRIRVRGRVRGGVRVQIEAGALLRELERARNGRCDERTWFGLRLGLAGARARVRGSVLG